MRWNKITIVGVGLLGGSLGMAIKRRRLARHVEGFVRRPSTIRLCAKFHAVDHASLDLTAAVRDADLVVLCTPLAQMQPLMKQMLAALKPGAIVTDVGSVKTSIVRELEGPVAGAGAYFAGSHPMAGAERNGVAAARANLFEGAICVVTPTRNSNKTAVGRVEDLWKSVGGRLLRLTPPQHDLLVSRSSHLPHLLAATLANYVLNPAHPKHQAALCATGFRDTTRIASGSPEMWRDIAMANRSYLAIALQQYIAHLRQLRRALGAKDAAAITAFFEQAKQRRDRWLEKAFLGSPE